MPPKNRRVRQLQLERNKRKRQQLDEALHDEKRKAREIRSPPAKAGFEGEHSSAAEASVDASLSRRAEEHSSSGKPLSRRKLGLTSNDNNGALNSEMERKSGEEKISKNCSDDTPHSSEPPRKQRRYPVAMATSTLAPLGSPLYKEGDNGNSDSSDNDPGCSTSGKIGNRPINSESANETKPSPTGTSPDNVRPKASFKAPPLGWKPNRNKVPVQFSDSDSDSDDAGTPSKEPQVLATTSNAQKQKHSTSDSDSDGTDFSSQDAQKIPRNTSDPDTSSDSHGFSPPKISDNEKLAASMALSRGDSLEVLKKPAKPKARKTRNPIEAEKLELQKTVDYQQHVLCRVAANDDALWDSDENDATTSRPQPRATTDRRSVARGRRTRRRHADDPDHESLGDAGAGEIDRDTRNNGSLRTASRNTAPTPAPSKDNEDPDEGANGSPERDQYPHLLNPIFGPFANEPLVLVNNETGKSHHKVPAALSRYLPDFQRKGIQFLYNAVINERGAILGDDMGLGKTLQVIALIAALLGKQGTRMDEVVLKKREQGLKKFEKGLGSLQERALLGQIGFFDKESYIAEFKEKLGLPKIMPILLLVPAVVIDNWHFEFSMWGHFRVAVYREGGLRDGALETIQYGSAEVLLCGHPLFGTSKEFKGILDIPWKLVVVDEFHLFKSPKTNYSKNLRRLTKKHECPLVGLTGTPMPNGFEELHNLVDLVQPGVLGSKKEFMAKTGNPIKNARTVDAPQETKDKGEKCRLELHKIMEPLYIHRKKVEVLQGMPKKTEHVVLCELSEAQKKTYEHIRNLPDFMLVRGANAPCDCGVNRNYFYHYQRLQSTSEKIAFQKQNKFIPRGKCCYKTPPDKEKTIFWRYQHPDSSPCKTCPSCVLFPCLTKLYQLSSHLTLLQFDRADKSVVGKDKEKEEAFSKIAFPEEVLADLPGESIDRCDGMMQGSHHFAMSGKMAKLDELLKHILHEQGRVLIFSYSTRTLDVIERYLDSGAQKHLRIDGKTPSKERQGLANKFQSDPKIFGFLLSTRAAGVGLNLTAANNVIIFDAEWNPAHDEQAQDRSFRIGQKRDVTVYRLISQGTIDELKYLRQIYKLHLRQEAFRPAEGSDASAPPRSFLGVEKDKERKGELFGMENLLNFSTNSFLGKVWKSNAKRAKPSLAVGNSDEIAKAWGDTGEAVLEHENEISLQKDIDVAASKSVEECPNTEGENETFVHRDFFQQDRVRPAYDDRGDVMGAETQAVDDFVAGPTHQAETSTESHNDDDKNTGELRDTMVADDMSNVSANLRDDSSIAEKMSNAEYDDESVDVDRRSPRKNQEVPTGASAAQHRINFTLCGIPANHVRGKHTTFSKADVFLPSNTTG